MNHRPSVEFPGVYQIIDDADDCDASEHRDAPVPVEKKMNDQQCSRTAVGRVKHRNQGDHNQTHIDFPSTLAKSGKKLITVEKSSNSSATTLIGTAHLPSDHLAGGNGSPYSLRQRTQAMLKA